MNRKTVICMCVGVAIGIGASIWLFFPYDLLAPGLDAAMLRGVSLVPPVLGGVIGFGAGHYEV